MRNAEDTVGVGVTVIYSVVYATIPERLFTEHEASIVAGKVFETRTPYKRCAWHCVWYTIGMLEWCNKISDRGTLISNSAA